MFALEVTPFVIAAGSRSETVCVWDRHTGALLATLRGHTGDVKCLAFVDDTTLASAAYDGRVLLRRFAASEAAPRSFGLTLQDAREACTVA